MAGGFEALAGFIFREQAAVDGALAGVVDLVGDAREVGIDTGELQVVVDLVEQVAERGGIAVTGADELAHGLGQFLLDGFFQHAAAHDGAGGEEGEEVAAGGFVEVAVGFFARGRGDDAFAEVGGARYGGFDEVEELGGDGGAEEIVLTGVEGELNGFPCWGVSVAGLLNAGERGEALAGVLDESLLHLVGEMFPLFDEGDGVRLIALPELVIKDGGQDGLEVGKTSGASELGDGRGELAARGVFIGHLEEHGTETIDFYGHVADGSTFAAPSSLRGVIAVAGYRAGWVSRLV